MKKMQELKLTEGFLSKVLQILFAKELDKRLDVLVSQIDTVQAEKDAANVRKSLANLQKSVDDLCKYTPNHPWCKRGAKPADVKWK